MCIIYKYTHSYMPNGSNTRRSELLNCSRVCIFKAARLPPDARRSHRRLYNYRVCLRASSVAPSGCGAHTHPTFASINAYLPRDFDAYMNPYGCITTPNGLPCRSTLDLFDLRRWGKVQASYSEGHFPIEHSRHIDVG